jgi:2-polyprenyl-6-methoxyphenol hydroxylase-like FAD-dependent oxidoreductase
VLVGDAAYNKDPITAQGISDAFRDAELCAAALDDVFSGRQSFDEAMLGYQLTRDRHVLPIYQFTCQMATMAPPPPDVTQLLAAVADNQEASQQFTGVIAGTVSPLEFFGPDNVGRILAAPLRA